MLQTYLTAYPWDLLGAGDALDRIHGELGPTGLSVWATTPAMMHLRPWQVEPRVFRTRGGLMFAPCDRQYSGTRCRSPVSSFAKSKNPLKKIAERCAALEMQLRLNISTGRIGRMATDQSEIAAKNVYGASSCAGVCLVNPDVQAFLRAMVADLCVIYTPASITLCDFSVAWTEAFSPDLRLPAMFGETERLLLSTCFCESCQQEASKAGVSASDAGRVVEAVIQTTIDRRKPAPQMKSLLADAEPLAAYFRWRDRELERLIVRLAEVCTVELRLHRPVACTLVHGHWKEEECPLAGVITTIADASQVESAACPNAPQSELRFSDAFTVGDGGEGLIPAISQARDLRFSGIEIDSYGQLTDATLTSVRQAVRFARRA